LPITPAVPQGWDNRAFRLGANLTVRLPSVAGYRQVIGDVLSDHHESGH